MTNTTLMKTKIALCYCLQIGRGLCEIEINC